ncbi:MAG: TonB-dependent receptor, partial [Bacteroidetes bacterium]
SDYQHPIGSNQMLEFGGKGIFRQVVSDYKYEISNSATGEFLIDQNNPSGILDYRQNVAATYLSYTYSTKSKLTFKGGARYEYTNIAAEIVGEDTLSIPDYGTLVPSLNISKNLKTGGAIKVGYNRRIQRPGLQQLNPNYNTANTQNITIGNPNLEPEMTDNIELSLSKNVKKTYFNVSLFGRITNNSITQVRQASDELQGAIITTFENIGKQQAIGTNVFANVFITPKWTVNGGVDMFYSFLEGRTTINGQSVPLSNSGFNINGRIMTQLTFGKGWTAQGFSFIRGGQVQLQGRQGGFYVYSLGARKDFKNKKGSIGLSAENFLARGIRVRTELSSPEFTSVNEDLRLNRGIKVNFTYKLGKMTFDAPRRKAKSVNNDDVKAGEGNGNQ